MASSKALRRLVLAALCGASFVASAAIQLVPVVPSGLSSPVFVTHAHDGSNRLFIVEKTGTVRVLQPGASTPTVFLDIHTRLTAADSEQGLLGLAFHPGYAGNGRFFVFYTRTGDGALVISEFAVSADRNVAGAAEKVLLTIPHPANTNHNGGMLAFGPDGYLYIGVGDGGSGNDPPNNAQNIQVLLGKMLRIDVDRADAAAGTPYSAPADNPFVNAPGRDEIFAYGLRNPWRFSFDRSTGQLWVGDVGQGAREEVDTPIVKGGNYGWRVYEGTACTNLDAALCNPANYLLPVLDYGHTGGRCSITGGYVYRGAQGALPLGTYVYADYCTGEMFSWNGSVQTALPDTPFNISSFGEDEQGEIYVVSLGGSVSRIANADVPGQLVNPSFELPAVGSNFQYAPSSAAAGWTFTGGAGVQGNGSAFAAAPAPTGTQTGFIQGVGAVSQTVSLAAGSYTLGFQVARRSFSVPANGVQPIRVSMDGQPIGADVVPAGGSFTLVAMPFTLAASGTHTLQFQGTDATGDKSTFIDAVTVAAGSAGQLANGSFEAPPVGAGYQYSPSGPGLAWSFGNGAGVQGNGSAWGAASAPEGAQTAFIQGLGNVTQTIDLAAGAYTLNLQLAQRPFSVPANAVQPIRVSIDGQSIAGDLAPPGTSFAPFSLPFSIGTAGAHTLQVSGTDGTGDKSTFVDAVSITTGSGPQQFTNASFEVPGLGANYQYSPAGAGWTFGDGAGIQGNGSAWAAPAATGGAQTAFIQNLGSLAQTIDLGAGSYTLSFQAARRAYSIPEGGVQPIRVSIDGQQIGSNAVASSTSFSSFAIPFTVTAGPHTFQFTGTDNSGDKSTFIDQVTIQ